MYLLTLSSLNRGCSNHDQMIPRVNRVVTSLSETPSTHRVVRLLLFLLIAYISASQNKFTTQINMYYFFSRNKSAVQIYQISVEQSLRWETQGYLNCYFLPRLAQALYHGLFAKWLVLKFTGRQNSTFPWRKKIAKVEF